MKYFFIALTIFSIIACSTETENERFTLDDRSTSETSNEELSLSAEKMTSILFYNPVYYKNTYSDVALSCGFNADGSTNSCIGIGCKKKSDKRYDCLKKHWLNSGRFECRKPKNNIDPKSYLERYPDLKAAFGNNCGLAMKHYVETGSFFCLKKGKCESRDASPF